MWEARMPTSVSRERGIHLRRTASVADLRQETLTSLLAVLPHLREGALLEDVRALANQHTGWILAQQLYTTDQLPGETRRTTFRATDDWLGIANWRGFDVAEEPGVVDVFWMGSRGF